MIIFKKVDGYFFSIDGQTFAKDSIQVQWLPDGINVNILHAGNSFYTNQPWEQIADGDNADTPFADLPTLKSYIDNEFYILRPFATPFKKVSAATVNATQVKAGETFLNSLTAVNTAGSARYVKVYDMADVPTWENIPILTFYLPPVNAIEGLDEYKPPTQQELLTEPLKFYYGLAFRITGAPADNDDTAIAAGDVVMNMIYR